MIADANGDSPATTALEVRVVTGAGGGPEKTILNSPRFLREHGYETICAYMHPPNDPGFETLRRRAAEWGAPLLSIPDRGLRDIGVVARIGKICRKHEVKIWHGHDYKSNLLGLLLRPFHRMKLVTTVHGWVNKEGNMPLYSAIDRWCLPKYHHVICVSKDLHEECLGLRIRPERLTLLENAIDETQYCVSADPATDKEKLGLPHDAFVIGGVGRLAEEKGFQFLLSAFARLVQENQNAILAIAGEGTERSALEKQARDLKITDNVRFLGYQENGRELFHAMDVFCLSSLREGLPNVLLEALASGVPCVATDLPGVLQVIDRTEEQGLLVPAANADALYGALKQLLVDKSQREDLARAGRQRIIDRFSFRNRMKRIAEIYNDL